MRRIGRFVFSSIRRRHQGGEAFNFQLCYDFSSSLSFDGLENFILFGLGSVRRIMEAEEPSFLWTLVTSPAGGEFVCVCVCLCISVRARACVCVPSFLQWTLNIMQPWRPWMRTSRETAPRPCRPSVQAVPPPPLPRESCEYKSTCTHNSFLLGPSATCQRHTRGRAGLFCVAQKWNKKLYYKTART